MTFKKILLDLDSVQIKSLILHNNDFNIFNDMIFSSLGNMM